VRQKTTARRAADRYSRKNPTYPRVKVILICIGLLVTIAVIAALISSMLLAAGQDDTTATPSPDSTSVLPSNSCLLGIPGALAVGDTVSGFGGYDWQVLDVREDKALIITKGIVGYRSYHSSDEDVTWSGCSLRGWLNSDFLGSSFSVDEKALIAPTTFANDGNPTYGVAGCEPTTDRIFLLSLSEAVGYLSVLMSGTAGSSATDEQNGGDGQWIRWWLRSPGAEQSYASVVDDSGSIWSDGNPVVDGQPGIRPACWIYIGVDIAFDPANCTVDVQNGWGIDGSAIYVMNELTQAGYAPGTTGNAASYSHDATQIIYRAEGDRTAAEDIRRRLGYGVLVPASERYDLAGNIMVIVGEDFEGGSDEQGN
jgi:hypothetical protein